MTELSTTAPAFVEMAHRIVWATVATVDRTGSPRTRILHPIWELDGSELRGWVATGPDSPKAQHLANESRVSITYWDPSQDTCTTDCDTSWVAGVEALTEAWNRFADAPDPVGYDPSIVPGWTEPTAPGFGALELRPMSLRVFPGTLLLRGEGELLTWRRP